MASCDIIIICVEDAVVNLVEAKTIVKLTLFCLIGVFDDVSWVASYNCVGRNVFGYDGSCSNDGSITDGNTTDDDGTAANLDIVANLRQNVGGMLVADGHVLPDFEIPAYAASTNARAVSVMNDEACTYFRTVDSTCVLGWDEPGDEFLRLAQPIIDHRTIFP